VEYCPVQYPDQFNREISENKAIHIYFAQAIPLIAYIDESCLYLKEKKCLICAGVCKNDAIDFYQKPKKIEIKIGAVILCPGYEAFDPTIKGRYGYGEFQNVVTSLDFERILCATGPYEGEILRASDKKHPRKIAWIQCVGSRRVTPGDNPYCSAVCCAYAQKQVILTKEHDSNAECVIFHNDIRSYGKDFETYFQRAENLPGVRFIRSYPSIDRQDPKTKNIIIRYATSDSQVKEEEFDMVVLSVGLNPPADHLKIAEKFQIKLNSYGFCKTDPSNPMQTTRPGIFISGAFSGPSDIPESVFGASGAGSQCGELLNYRRDKLTKERIYPQEIDQSGEEPKIGVFVCHCGSNIGRVVDVPSAVQYASTLPNVVYACEQLFSCATNSAKEITDAIKEKGLNRVIIAACSPRTLEPLFRDTLKEAGINQYFCEMANIREHNSWVHSKEKEEATQKAKDIIKMAAARAAHLEPLQEIDLPVNKTALIIGGGIAGMTCALSIAEQNHPVYLIEKNNDLGGIAKKIRYLLENLDISAHLNNLISKVYKHPLIRVRTEVEITGAYGYVGNFETEIRYKNQTEKIKHGAAVIAIGAREYKPKEYLYGKDKRVVTNLQLENLIAQKDNSVISAKNIAMIQCVGCRNEDRNYCSRICCSESIKNGLKLKEINPDIDIYILFRDIRTYGFKEDYYREAAENNIKFIRYKPEAKPEVKAIDESGKTILRVAIYDYILGRKIAIDADIISLAAAVLPPEDNKKISLLFKVPLGPDNFFKEAHVKLKPVEFGTDGVYLCGTAHYPKHISETISQAYGAAGRALTLLARDIVTVSGSVCEVEEKKCIGCEACISACTYNAIELRKTKQGGKAFVNPVLCKGDGLCNAKCPTGAISLKHFTDKEILSQIDAAA